MYGTLVMYIKLHPPNVPFVRMYPTFCTQMYQMWVNVGLYILIHNATLRYVYLAMYHHVWCTCGYIDKM
jgi:hypothetical protein